MKKGNHTKIYFENFPTFLEKTRERIENFLAKTLLKDLRNSGQLGNAMEYSLLNGGKRLRAAMTFSVEERLSVPQTVSNHIAASIECLHTCSLIHDDMPAIDNDDLRRGKPTCHIAFGEAIALLAGDALLNLSHHFIHTIPRTLLSGDTIVNLSCYLSTVIGTEGLIGGQAAELSSPTGDKLYDIYYKKTGLLLGAGLKLMLITTSQAETPLAAQLEQFTYHLGIAYQIQDDLLDLESPAEITGKNQLSDQAADRHTMLAEVGVEKARELVAEHFKRAMGYLTPHQWPELEKVAHFIMRRKY